MNCYTSPIKGCSIYATEHHMTKQSGTLLGIVHHTDNNICYFTDNMGEIDTFIWKTKEGVNPWVMYGP